MGTYRGNTDRVMADAAKIAERLKNTPATLTGLMKEYHCAWHIIMSAVLSQMSKKQWYRIRKRKLHHGNVAHHFPKGHKTWNKNRKGIHLSPATEFKKGHLPANHKHVGTIRISTREREGGTNQFREIKVSGILQGRHKWISHARYLYEQKHGPIPKGRFVVHVDGNSMNDDPDNLRSVDRRGHLALQMQRDPNMLKKCRRKAGRAARKRHKATRRRKARLLKISQKTRVRVRRSVSEESRYKANLEKEIKNIRGALVVWWECTGCGEDYHQKEPPSQCTKCIGGGFEKIKRRQAG